MADNIGYWAVGYWPTGYWAASPVTVGDYWPEEGTAPPIPADTLILSGAADIVRLGGSILG